MSKSNDDIYKEIIKLSKDITQIDSKLKDIIYIKKQLKSLDKKVQDILNKVQEFEVIMDAAEFLEEHLEDSEEDTYNTEWSPYNDEDYESEEYESYDEDDEL